MGRTTDGANEPQPGNEAAVERRAFLARGGLVAGGAALGAVLAPTGAGAQVAAQAIDTVYLPIPPTRVYDSRSASGPLFIGQTRTLIFDLSTLDPIPFALCFNMTVTLTRQKGWLALYPANAVFDGTSSINWFGDSQDLANNAYVELPQTGDPATDWNLKVSCGGSAGAQSDFILDLIAVTASFTVAAVGAASISSQVKAFAANLPPVIEA